MRVGIFGGTFDPIHSGHLVLAEQCREQCKLDEVWFVPAALPPHKLTAAITSPKSRCEMIEFAITGNPAFRLSKIELDRTGPSFTVTTLEQLHLQEGGQELFLLIGADSLKDLPHWREPARILELATVVAVNRGDRPLPITMPGIDISSTDIRGRVQERRSIRYLVPRAVEMYIHERGLFRTRETGVSQ